MSDTLPFELVTETHAVGELRVIALSAVEEMNGAYHARVTVSCPAEVAYLGDLEGMLLGKPAAVTLQSPHARRRLHGVVSAVRIVGVDPKPLDGHGRGRIELEIVPRFALLALRRQSRIFQDKTVREIVEAILVEWKIAHGFQLIGTYKPRPYVTQHGETDYDFVRRILAVEGIGYFLATSSANAPLKDAPEVVFFDAASAYAPLPAADLIHGGAGRPGALRHAHSTFEHRADDVTDFSLHRELAPRSAILGDFDFRRPQTGLRAVSRNGGANAVSAFEESEKLDAYFYADRQELEGSGGAEIDEDRAQIGLEQLRRQARVGRGKTRAARVAPGLTFTLEGHALDSVNQAYVITKVEHHGTAPDLGGNEAASYEASFSVVPGAVVFRPPIDRATRMVHGAETATVVGPKGEDVYTDAFGRVKVRFHWDQDGKGDEHSSCWLRVAEAWAGQRWGTQFVPRVGMEVLVTFLGGDPDRPLVTGCLYNTTHPTPFRLPSDKHRSGLRTQSSDGGGFNELSFQDLAGEEQILMAAKRNLDITVGHDASTQVRGDETHAVSGSHTVHVHGKQSTMVDSDNTLNVTGAHTHSVKGDHKLVVAGSHSQSVSGASALSVAGDMVATIAGNIHPAVGGGSELKLAGDAVLRAEGHFVTIVGAHDSMTSATVHVQGSTELFGAGVTEIISETAIKLRVGKSSICIYPDAIDIDADTIRLRAREALYGKAGDTISLISRGLARLEGDEEVFLQAEAATVKLTRDARIDGDLVKLNCSPEPAVTPKRAHKKEVKPTKFSLVDDNGKPLAGQRMVVLLADGTERATVLDKDGKAELELDDSGDVVFPDVSKPKPA
jgi:type VI secretion system secreted protein VgrG